MKYVCGIIRKIQPTDYCSTVLIVDVIYPPERTGEQEAWDISHFDRCHRFPEIGDKVYMNQIERFMWKGSFYPPKSNRILDWTKVGF